MGRTCALVKWEFNDVIRNVVFLSGTVLVEMSMKRSIMGVTYVTGFASGTSMEFFGPSRAMDLSRAIQSTLTRTDVWTLTGFLILLFGALIFRCDRDRGVAHSIYSLSYSNTEIFGIKLLSLLVYSFTMIFLPFTYVILTSYADIAGYLPEVTSNFLGKALVLVTFLVLYLVAMQQLFLSPHRTPS